MPLYSIDSRSRTLKQGFERTPRISIVTDVADVQSIPREIRAIVRDERRILRDVSQWFKSRDDADACLVWADGDRLLEGSVPDLLKRLHSADRRSFVVINTLCIEEVPFVTMQPRIFAGKASTDYWSFQIRLESSAETTNCISEDPRRLDEPWVKLQGAVATERITRGSGIEPLLRLWESREKLPDIIRALVCRNLVAAMLLHQEVANARNFLEAGTKLFPNYAELYYLAALLAVGERRSVEAVSLLQKAKSCGVLIPGSGGENSYRSDWLLGVIAAQVRDDRVAFQRFLSGVQHKPLFEPSLTDLLKLRLPYSLIESNRHVFTQAARRNPHTAKSVAEFLRMHRVFEAADLVDPSGPSSSVEGRCDKNSVKSSTSPPHNSQVPAEDTKQALGVSFEGQFFEHSSLARVNREIARGLLASNELELRVETSAPASLPPHMLLGGEDLVDRVHRPVHHINLTIRHQWPPNFRRPPTGKLAVILPWEFGGVPRVWVDRIEGDVDELWVPSEFVRDVFVRNGVGADRVSVIANGYDPKTFSTEGPRFRPEGSRNFVFLFVGGAIPRKGLDLLLDAYKAAFDESEQVTLVLLVSGSSGAYQHNSLTADIQAAVTSLKQPHVLAMFDTIDDAALAALYRGSDAFVLPYRGEGFGMPLLEAMACGKPVITTALGPAKEFCRESNSYLIPASADLVFDPPPLGPIVGSFTWFEPSFLELVKTLRHVYENRGEAVAKGRTAAESVRHLTWQDAASRYLTRIQQLCKPQ